MCNIGCKNESRDGTCRLPRMPKDCAMGRAEQEAAKIRCYECGAECKEFYKDMQFADVVLSNAHYLKCTGCGGILLPHDTLIRLEKEGL